MKHVEREIWIMRVLSEIKGNIFTTKLYEVINSEPEQIETSELEPTTDTI